MILSTSGPEKELHHWQQALDPMQQIIAMVSKPNELVRDPFSGSTTTGIAALSQVGPSSDLRSIQRRRALE